MKAKRSRIKEEGRGSPERLTQFAFACAPALIIDAAVTCGIFDALEAGARTVAQVAATTNCSERGVHAVMNALAGLGLLTKQDISYSLGSDAFTYLVSTRTSFFGGYFRYFTQRVIPMWLRLPEVIRTGRPVRDVTQEQTGTECFREFVPALFPANRGAALALAKELRVSETAVPICGLDLAAGSGVWGISLAQQSCHVRVTAVDWEGVIPVTRQMAARFGVEDRVQFLSGDLLQAGFGRNYSIAILGHILHGWSEDDCAALISKTFHALADGGTIVIAEWLVNEDRTGPLHSLIFAVELLVATEHGNTFSFQQIKCWLEAAGFENVRLLDAPAPSPLILADKPSK